MSFKTRLLLCFLSLTLLIGLVGIGLYYQTKQMAIPFSSGNISSKVEQLIKIINRNTLITRLLYQQLNVQYVLENYLAYHDKTFLQRYYTSSEINLQLLNRIENEYPELWNDIKPFTNKIMELENDILLLAKQGKFDEAKELLIKNDYWNTTLALRRIVNIYYQKFVLPSNEGSTFSVKLQADNLDKLAKDRLKTIFIIFFDAIVASLILIYFSVRAIIKPIQTLRDDIEKMSASNLQQPIDKSVLKSGGEIGELAKSFANLMNKLRTTTVLKDELLNEVEKRKLSEEKLKQTAINLQESNKELDQFAYAASHDLRAPLRGIENLANWIEEDCKDTLPDEAKKHLILLRNRIHRLDSLIAGILEYSRAGKTAVRLEVIDLNKLLLEIIENLSPPENCEIIIDGNMPILTNNRVVLTQIFLNLLSNSIKYNDKPQMKINIGCISHDENFEFYVKDNGPGIDKIFHEKIFEVFQTLQPRDTIESVGIGLAIVKKIIEKLGGRIWIESEVNQGTTFRFIIPKFIKALDPSDNPAQ